MVFKYTAKYLNTAPLQESCTKAKVFGLVSLIYRDLIKIKTEKDGFYDITKEIAAVVEKSKIKDGLCNVFVKGTTASLLLNENDRMLIEDFRKLFQRMAPGDHLYQHPDNAQSHLRASMLNIDLTIPVADRKLTLGTWQSLLLFEFDIQPREREIIVTVQGA